MQRDVSPHAAHRRHDMGRITDEQQTQFVPALEAARLDRQDGDLLPLFQLAHSVGQFRHRLRQRLAQMLQASGPYLLVAALRDEIAHLPVVEAVDEHHQEPIAKVATQVLRQVVLPAREPEPEDIRQQPEEVQRRIVQLIRDELEEREWETSAELQAAIAEAQSELAAGDWLDFTDYDRLRREQS